MSKNYVELKVSELRDECKTRGLDTSGLKVHLVERLNKFDREQLLKNKVEEKPAIIIDDAKVEAKTRLEINAIQIEKEEVKHCVSESIQLNDMPESNFLENQVEMKEDRKRTHSPHPVVEHKIENLIELASKEPNSWENRTDVHLDFYNSDINLVIDALGYSAIPLHEHGFEFMCCGAKANYGFKSGKIFYEVKLVKQLISDLNDDCCESNFIRIGWSIDNNLLALGESILSFGYDGSGKKIRDGNLSDFGVKFDEGSIIGCFLEFNGDSFSIRYSVNGVNQGEAFSVLSRELKDHTLVPHVYTKNVKFEVNFGQNDNEAIFPPKMETEALSIDDLTWTLVGKVNLNQRTRVLMPPKAKSECEVLMMCGLPGCGKTVWTEKQNKENPDKCYNILSVNTILEKMQVSNLRKKLSSSRWEFFISQATNCLNKLMEIAVSRRRNFILDQTNVYPSAQRRRMKPFEEFIRKAIIIVPTDDEYQRRMNQVIQDEGKDVPESAVLQLKENFVIPEENSDLFNEIIFIELQRTEAEELIKKYSEEAKNHKKKDANADDKSKADSDDESFGKWSSSPKATSEDNEPSAPKKSRWNDQSDTRKDSKNRDRHDRSSNERLPRKNDYKGGFCFSREASDSGKSNRFNDSGFRSDDKYSDKSRSQKNDRSGNRSNTSSYRNASDSNDRRPKFDRDDSKFNNRNQMGGNRDSRPRDRGSDSRSSGNQFQRGDRGRGGYNNDRRPMNSYDDGETRGKYGQSNYNDRNAMNAPNYTNPERTNRFQPNMPERHDFRGRGRGAISGNQHPSYAKESFSDRRNMPEYQNYSEFNPPFEDNRQSNMPWQSDYKHGSMDGARGAQGFDIGNSRGSQGYDVNNRGSQGFDANNRGSQGYDANNRGSQGYDNSNRGPQGYDNSNRGPNQSSSYEQNFSRGPIGGGALPTGRDKNSDQYDRKPSTNSRGAQHNRGGRTMSGLMDTPQMDEYTYGSSKNYDAPMSKFAANNKPPYSDMPAGSAYKDPVRQEMSYSTAKTPVRGGYSKFGIESQKPNVYDNKAADYSTMQSAQSNTYDNYQSYDSSQYNQSQGYYNYYTGGTDTSKDQSTGASANYSSMSAASNRTTGYQPSYGSSNQSAEQSYQSNHPSSNATGAGGYQSSNATSASYQASNYPLSNTTNSAAYQSNYSTGSTGGYQTNYPSSNATSGTSGYMSSYQSTNASSAGTASNYTNPYSAFYENTSSNNSSYYGHTNTYAQSGNYGDKTVTSKFSDYNSKLPSTDRTIPPPTAATQPNSQASSAGQTQANWGAGYGDYSQYYGQYYGN